MNARRSGFSVAAGTGSEASGGTEEFDRRAKPLHLPASMAEERDSYALARIDLPDAGTHGWQVRLQRRGKKFAKFFADRLYGGPQRAMQAGKLWRDALLQELDQADQIRICARSERNQSGVVGVSKVRVTTNGASYEFWQATWSPEPGRRRSVKFSIRRYGERRAFRLAVEAREEGIGKEPSG